ncbi:MAG: hypothetical protein LKM43_02245 [Wolbachia endosymbiont of Penenirmus auritus]|nr:hypothetical protein [Wolbachia endosymbiont of Penenirmus auritus]
MLSNFILKTKELSSSPESKVYVKDLRKVVTYNGKKCQYPKNYDQIVEFGKIIESKNSDGKTTYMLLYGPKDKNGEQSSFKLTLVKEAGDRSCFAVDYRDNQGKQIPIDWLDRSYFEPLGFSRLDLRKRVPVFEAQKTGDPKYPFKLTNSSILTKKEKSKEGKIQEVVDLEGRNGELLYTSDYKKLSTSFYEIRDQNGNLELDKSLISVPIVLAAGSAKKIAKWLTSIPMELGEHLVNRQNPIAKFFGYLLFAPAMAVKNLVNMGATVLKAPILLFVADKKKYGDSYWTMWKHQLKEYWKETKNDYSVIKEGKRSEPEEKDYPKYKIAGTWKELDARRPDIEKELDEQENNKEANKGNNDKNKSEEQKQNLSNEILSSKKEGHANKVLNRRNSLRDGETSLPPH